MVPVVLDGDQDVPPAHVDAVDGTPVRVADGNLGPWTRKASTLHQQAQPGRAWRLGAWVAKVKGSTQSWQSR